MRPLFINLVFAIFVFLATGLICDENKECFRCHKMESLSELQPDGSIRSFHISEKHFQISNHSKLSCSECHETGYKQYPHTAEEAVRSTDCNSCHKDHHLFDFSNTNCETQPAGGCRTQEKKELIAKIDSIVTEFENSTHFKNAKSIHCFTCHNPHTFNKEEEKKAGLKNFISLENDVCLSCHTNKTKYTSYQKPDSKKEWKELAWVHEWIPSRELHWQNVRCLDCHSSYQNTNLSHHILPSEDAVRNCNSCHTDKSILNDKLYKLYSQQEKERYGMINSILWNQAYIIGATRNVWLDGISSLSFAGGLFAMCVHAFFRYRANRKGKHNE
jgi:hypothetical protein